VFDTNLVVVGNVLAAPEWRRIASSGSLVAHFRVASTSRRFDRETGRWVDGNSFRVRVTAWRRLAESVAASIAVGDPVMVYGRLYTRDWQDDNDNKRTSYEMEAFSIGHDLARGRGRFFRHHADGKAASVVEEDDDLTIGGEHAERIPPGEAPIGYGDGVPDEAEPSFPDVLPGPPDPADAEGPDSADDLTLEVERLVADQPGAPRRSRRGRREPVAA
jgi:single-strand DNA-binding protein